jgi:hypothetical protein
MARLLKKIYPFPKYEDYDNTMKYVKDCEVELNKIPRDKLIKFSVADGYAYYYVVSLEPLVLQFINFLDGYSISYAEIRGLRKADIDSQILLSNMFRK